MSNEIKKQMDVICSGITEIQDTVSKYDERLTGLEEEKIDKINNTVTKAAEEVEVIKQKQDDFAKKQKDLEILLSRPQGDGKNIPKSLVSDVTKEAFMAFVRLGAPLPQDSVKEICIGIVESSLKGVSRDEVKMSADALYKKTMAIGNNPRGGYWVPVEMSDEVITRTFETSPMRELASIITIGTSSIKLPIDDEEISEPDKRGELDSGTDAEEPDIGEKEYHVHELFTKVKVTRQLLEDAVTDPIVWLQNKVSDKIGRTENKAFINGTGVKEARGILTYPNWSTPGVYMREAIEQYESSVANSFIADDVLEVQNMVKEDYQKNATWLMNRRTWGTITRFKDDNGQYLLNPQILAQGVGLRLYDNPVRLFADFPTRTTTDTTYTSDDLVIAFGDFRMGYQIVDRIGILLIRDDITSDKFVIFKFRTRYGGDLKSFEAFKLLRIQ